MSIFLNNSLWPESSFKQFLPLTIGYDRRVRKQQAELDRQRRLHEEEMRRLAERKAREKAEAARLKRKEELRRNDPKEYERLYGYRNSYTNAMSVSGRYL